MLERVQLHREIGTLSGAGLLLISTSQGDPIDQTLRLQRGMALANPSCSRLRAAVQRVFTWGEQLSVDQLLCLVVGCGAVVVACA